MWSESDAQKWLKNTGQKLSAEKKATMGQQIQGPWVVCVCVFPLGTPISSQTMLVSGLAMRNCLK